MKQIVRFLNTFVFLAATAVLVGVYYEGMAREWFPIVGIFILAADYSFLVSAMINLVYFRKQKNLLIMSILSMVLIAIAFVMKVRGMSYPIWSVAAWNFYIWLYYGYLVIKGAWKPKRKRIFAK
jgi:hypothetical membrane protein